MAPRAQILDIDGDGDVIHVELATDDGETVVGVYQLIGWTKPPKARKEAAERAVWASAAGRDDA